MIGITTATAVTTGLTQSCARLSNGRLRCWGANEHGQLGNGGTTPSPVPVDVTRRRWPMPYGQAAAMSAPARGQRHPLLGQQHQQPARQRDPRPGGRAQLDERQPAVATIVASGVAQVLAPGVTTIAASYADGASANC